MSYKRPTHLPDPLSSFTDEQYQQLAKMIENMSLYLMEKMTIEIDTVRKDISSLLKIHERTARAMTES